MKNPWEEYGSGAAQNPWEVYGGRGAPVSDAAPRTEPTLPAIDFNRPEADVRADVAKISDPEIKKRVLDKWAEAYVAKEYGGKKGTPSDGSVPVAAGPAGTAIAKIISSYVSALPGVGGDASRTSADAPIRNVARGTIAGTWADELNAATYGGIHKLTGGLAGKPYDEVLAYQRALDRWNDRQDPVGSTVAQVGGALAGPQIVANALMGGAKTLPGKIVRGASIGAVGGATAGAGNAEDDKTSGAVSGATVGGTIGALIPPAVQGVVFGANRVSDLVNPTLARFRNGPDAAAERILGQRIQASGKTTADVQRELDAGRSARQVGSGNSLADLPETIADTSNSMQRVLGSAYRAGGEAGDFVKGTLDARQRGPRNLYAPSKNEPAGQHERIMDAVDRSMGIKTSKGAYKTEQALVQETKAEAAKNYSLASERQDPFDLQPAFDAMALKIQQYPPPVASQLSKALSYFVNDKNTAGSAAIARITKGMDDLAIATTVEGQAAARDMITNGFNTLKQVRAKSNAPFAVDNIQRFDYAKRALDDMIDGAQGNIKRELVDFKNSLLDLVHAPSGDGISNPFYKVARESFADGKRGQDAIQLGRDAFKMDPEAFMDQYRALDAAQQKMARIGFRDALRGKLAGTKPGDDTTQLFQRKNTVDLLSEMIPGRARPERFGEYISREGRMSQTRNTALYGSQTAERANDDAQFAGNLLSEMWSKFKNAPTIKGALIESVGYGLQKAFAFRQDVALAMAQRLLESDPARQRAILQSIEKRMGPDAFSDFVDELNRKALSVGAAFTVQETRPSVSVGSP